MKRSVLEKILEESRDDLQRIRQTYFPLIVGDIITGYNLYVDNPQENVEGLGLSLSYFHSDLRPNDKHFVQLSDILKKEGFVKEIPFVRNSLVDRSNLVIERNSTYLIIPEWVNPGNMSYFDLDGDYYQKKRQNIWGEKL